MSQKYRGDTLDIHSGGIDHIPVHHTNEIAQSEAATGKQYARYWMHTNHILVDDEKIAKSAGNGTTLEDIEAKGYNLEAFRLLVLESHYRSQSKFSWEAMEAAQNRLQNLRAMAALKWQAREKVYDSGTFALENIPNELLRVLSEDLNTPAALAYLSEVENQLNTVLIEQDMLDHFEHMLKGIDSVLGLHLSETPDISAEQKELIREREAARQGQDWQAADAIRNQLTDQKIGVRDTSSGPVWFPL
jgi:cysteinyl-tRNA synthetase